MQNPTSIRIPDHLLAKLDKLQTEKVRSRNYIIIEILEKFFREEKTKKK